MRKYFLLILSLLPWVLSAEHVPVDRARSAAEQFLRSNLPTTRSASLELELVWDGTDRFPDTKSDQTATSAPADFYVFNNTAGGGYVIISGDDATMPVLAYSLRNNMDSRNLPVNFVSWMKFISREMEHQRQSGKTASPAIQARWTALEQRGTPVGKVVKYHQTASWDQADPYWNECPMYRKKRTYTGCVITAVSTVMKFHSWPERGHGKTESYTTETKKIKVSARTLGEKYEWNKMPLKYFDDYGSPIYTSEQAAQVSRLMADVGAILQADYGTDDIGGTGAFSEDIPAALVQYMGYDRSIWCASRDHYPYATWLDMLKNELAESPLVYGGVSRDGGHSFVLDGYTENDYFHVNWGWGGMSDGYFLLSALDPDQQGAGGSSSSFDTYQDAILNMRPEHGGEAVQQMLMIPLVDEEYDIDYHGITASVRNIRKGEPFQVTAGALINAGFEAFECEVLLAVAGSDGSIRENLYKDAFAGKDLLESGYVYGLDDIPVVIKNDILPGDRIKLFYKTAKMTDFVPVLGAVEDGFTFELILMEGETVPETGEPDFAHEISLFIDNQEKRMIVGLPDGVSLLLQDASGKNLSEKVTTGTHSVTVDLLYLDKGKYRLVFSKGRQQKIVEFNY